MKRRLLMFLLLNVSCKQNAFKAVSKHVLSAQEYLNGKSKVEVSQLMAREKINVSTTDKEGKITLVWASGCVDIESVRKLVESGANVNSIDMYGKSPIMWASGFGHGDVVAFLLNNGADPTLSCLGYKGTTRGKNALMYASEHGHTGVVELLLEREPKIVNTAQYNGKTALTYASINGKQEVVKLLLRRGAKDSIDKDGKTSLSRAIEKIREESDNHESYLNISEFLFNNGNSSSLLKSITNGQDLINLLLISLAVVNNSEEDLIQLFKDGVSPDTILNKYGETLLISQIHRYRIRKNTNIILILLEAGVNIHLSDISGKDAVQYIEESRDGYLKALISERDTICACLEHCVAKDKYKIVARYIQLLVDTGVLYGSKDQDSLRDIVLYLEYNDFSDNEIAHWKSMID